MRRGATLMEYALLVGLIAVVAVAVIVNFGDEIRALFTGSKNVTDDAVQLVNSVDLKAAIKESQQGSKDQKR